MHPSTMVKEGDPDINIEIAFKINGNFVTLDITYESATRISGSNSKTSRTKSD